MKPFSALILLVLSYSCSSGRQAEPAFIPGKIVHLASPRCIADSVLFLQSATLIMELDYPGVSIYYTEDAGAPTPDSHLYQGAIEIEASKTIRARAFHPDFLPSETVSRQFVQASQASRHAKVEVYPEAHASYPGKGPASLVDLQKGGLSFRGDDSWMGFQSDTIDIRLSLEQAQAVESVTLSVLEEHGSWIFLPERVDVFINGKRAGQESWPSAVSAAPPALRFLVVPVTNTTAKDIQVRVINRASIPDWHPGKGTPPWLFIDELLIN